MNIDNLLEKVSYTVPQEQSKFLLSSSYLLSIPLLIAYLMEDWYTLFFVTMLLFTSINYWRDVRAGFRRNLDITVVIITSCYFLIESIKKQPFDHLVIICFYFICATVFYLIEKLLYLFKSNKWIILHMSMHIYFIAIVIYYYSHIYMINYEDRYKWLNFVTLLFDLFP